MVLGDLNNMENQIWGISGLGYLIASGTLGRNLGAFLVACRVNELSHRTIGDYREKIGSFVRYCVELGATEPSLSRQFRLGLSSGVSAESFRLYSA